MQQTLTTSKMSPSNILPGLLRKMTVRAVFETLQREGAGSRADLARSTGISPPTISKAVSELLSRRLVSETMTSENILGRPGMLLTLHGAAARVIGIAIRGRETEISIASLDGRVDETQTGTLPVSIADPDWMCRVMDMINLYRTLPGIELIGIGICGEKLDLHPGDSSEAGSLAGSQWRRIVETADQLSDLAGLPSTALLPGQAVALAERLIGAARTLTDFVVMDISSSPSLGAFIDGQLLTGRSGMAGYLNLTGPDADVPPDDPEFLAAAISSVIGLFNPSALFLRSHSLKIDGQCLPRLRQLMEQMNLAALSDCDVQLTSVSLLDAAVAAIVDEITRGLGPRLSVPLPGTAMFAG